MDLPKALARMSEQDVLRVDAMWWGRYTAVIEKAAKNGAWTDAERQEAARCKSMVDLCMDELKRRADALRVGTAARAFTAGRMAG